MMVLVTGGASSGKSAFAEQVACSLPGSRYYLAAMKPYGEEGARRIARHRELRAGKGFATLECYDGLRLVTEDMVPREQQAEASAPEASDWASCESGATGSSSPRLKDAPRTALLESLGNVVANELYSDEGAFLGEQTALEGVLDGVSHVAGLFDNLVIGGDEVGSDGLRYDEQTMAYIRVIGTASCSIAAQSDVVVECVAGQPFFVKGAGLI